MEKLLLIKYGEIMLKGLNRPVFIKKLENNVRDVLRGAFEFEIMSEHGRFYIKILSGDMQKAALKIADVFGIVSVSIAAKTSLSPAGIMEAAVEYAKDEVKEGGKTFKIETKRPNKKFEYDSMEFSALAGAKVLERIPELKVDVKNPDFKIYVEIRRNAYVYTKSIRAGGGIPVGSSGKGIVLLSGGIDSPVAAYMMAKRGLLQEGVYFHSHPYTTELAKKKVISLASKISRFCGPVKLHVVNFTEAQMEIYDKCPHSELTIIMRRVMMKVAERIALKTGASALVTGESLGQVASQTLESLAVTNSAVEMPVFRPLIGMDKYEVIEIAKKIDTYETSILPYEDCCTIFVAKHPQTRPRLEDIIESEKNIDVEKMVDRCLEDIETVEA